MIENDFLKGMAFNSAIDYYKWIQIKAKKVILAH